MNPAIATAIEEQLAGLRTTSAFYESRAAQLRAEADEMDAKKTETDAKIADLQGALG